MATPQQKAAELAQEVQTALANDSIIDATEANAILNNYPELRAAKNKRKAEITGETRSLLNAFNSALSRGDKTRFQKGLGITDTVGQYGKADGSVYGQTITALIDTADGTAHTGRSVNSNEGRNTGGVAPRIETVKLSGSIRSNDPKFDELNIPSFNAIFSGKSVESLKKTRTELVSGTFNRSDYVGGLGYEHAGLFFDDAESEQFALALQTLINEATSTTAAAMAPAAPRSSATALLKAKGTIGVRETAVQTELQSIRIKGDSKTVSAVFPDLNMESFNAMVVNKSPSDLRKLYQDYKRTPTYEFITSLGYKNEGLFFEWDTAEVAQFGQALLYRTKTKERANDDGFMYNILQISDLDGDGTIDANTRWAGGSEIGLFWALADLSNAELQNLLKRAGTNGTELADAPQTARQKMRDYLEPQLALGGSLQAALRNQQKQFLEQKGKIENTISQDYARVITETMRAHPKYKEMLRRLPNGTNVQQFESAIQLESINIIVGVAFGATATFDVSKATNALMEKATLGLVNGIPVAILSWDALNLFGLNFLKSIGLEANIGLVTVIPFVDVGYALIREPGKQAYFQNKVEGKYVASLHAGVSPVLLGLGVTIDWNRKPEIDKTIFHMDTLFHAIGLSIAHQEREQLSDADAQNEFNSIVQSYNLPNLPTEKAWEMRTKVKKLHVELGRPLEDIIKAYQKVTTDAIYRESAHVSITSINLGAILTALVATSVLASVSGGLAIFGLLGLGGEYIGASLKPSEDRTGEDIESKITRKSATERMHPSLLALKQAETWAGRTLIVPKGAEIGAVVMTDSTRRDVGIEKDDAGNVAAYGLKPTDSIYLVEETVNSEVRRALFIGGLPPANTYGKIEFPAPSYGRAPSGSIESLLNAGVTAQQVSSTQASPLTHDAEVYRAVESIAQAIDAATNATYYRNDTLQKAIARDLQNGTTTQWDKTIRDFSKRRDLKPIATQMQWITDPEQRLALLSAVFSCMMKDAYLPATSDNTRTPKSGQTMGTFDQARHKAFDTEIKKFARGADIAQHQAVRETYLNGFEGNKNFTQRDYNDGDSVFFPVGAKLNGGFRGTVGRTGRTTVAQNPNGNDFVPNSDPRLLSDLVDLVPDHVVAAFTRALGLKNDAETRAEMKKGTAGKTGAQVDYCKWGDCFNDCYRLRFGAAQSLGIEMGSSTIMARNVQENTAMQFGLTALMGLTQQNQQTTTKPKSITEVDVTETPPPTSTTTIGVTETGSQTVIIVPPPVVPPKPPVGPGNSW